MTLPIFVPNTRIREATAVFLAQQKRTNPIHRIDVSGDRWGYPDYWQARWDEGETFISIEHDIVPWPGAIEDLQACPEHWCVFGYLPEMDCAVDRCAPVGLVKFGAKLIAAVPDVWQRMRIDFADDCNAWQYCDVFAYQYIAVGRGIAPHQHYPAVFNANPQPSGSYFPIVEPVVTEVTVWQDLDPVATIEVRGDAEFSTRANGNHRVMVNAMAASKCCNRCGDFYTPGECGARHCGPCGFYPDGYPVAAR